MPPLAADLLLLLESHLGFFIARECLRRGLDSDSSIFISNSNGWAFGFLKLDLIFFLLRLEGAVLTAADLVRHFPHLLLG